MARLELDHGVRGRPHYNYGGTLAGKVLVSDTMEVISEKRELMSLKKRLKQWELDFHSTHERKPTKVGHMG